jgi:hypothetical protein
MRVIASCTVAYGVTVTTRTVIASPTAMPDEHIGATRACNKRRKQKTLL